MCKNATLCLYGNRVVISGDGLDVLNFAFEDVKAVTVLGRNKLNIYHGDGVYQFKGVKRFNALKYVNIYYRWKNVTRGAAEATFLGI